MNDPFFNIPIGEDIRIGVYRAKRWGYSPEPDEVVPAYAFAYMGVPLCDGANLIVNNGRIFLAQRINGADTVASRMQHMAVGTATAAPALTDTTLPGEVGRKTSSISSATTNNRYTNTATWGGAADSVTSLAIAEAGVFNHASSGNGTMFQRVTFAAVTLAASDLLKVELTTIVGSNTI